MKLFCTLLSSLTIVGSSWGIFQTAPSIQMSEQLSLPSDLKSNKQIQQGLKALKDQLPLIAISHFQEARKKVKEQDNNMVYLDLLLAESFIRAKEPQKGLDVLATLPPSDILDYWKAIALLQQGKYVASMEAINQISAENNELQPYVYLFQAKLGRELNDSALLLNALKNLFKSENSQLSSLSQFLYIDTLIEIKQLDEAQRAIDELRQSPHLTEALKPYLDLMEMKKNISQGQYGKVLEKSQYIRTQYAQNKPVMELGEILLAQAEMDEEKQQQADVEKLGQEDQANTLDAGKADDRLANFISSSPDSPYLAQAFLLLEKESAFNDPLIYEKLVTWSKSKEKHRQPWALLALGKIYLVKNEWANAVKLAQTALKNYPQHQASQALVLQVINLLLNERHTKEAGELIALYPKKDPNILFQQGREAFIKQDYALATKLFQEAQQMGNDHLSQASLFNKNLSALWAGAKEIQEASPLEATSTKEKRALEYEQLHYAAKRLNPGIIDQLKAFTEKTDSTFYRVPALLDLAEVALSVSPPELQTAKKTIQELNQLDLNTKEAERLITLEILLPEALQLWPEAIAACRKAIDNEAHNNKDLLSLKLGELLYRNGNFNEALLVLQPFPDQFPNSSYKQSALFLAGKAAQQCKTSATLEKALDIFNRLSDASSPFSHAAQLEAASILLEMGQSQESIDKLNQLMKQNLSHYDKLMALSIQADAWIQEANEDKIKLQQAVKLCTEILDSPNIGLAWKFKALSQRAQCYERIGDISAALNDYANILSHTPTNDGQNRRRDWYWFYNAGFSSLRLMELQEDWNSALALAEKLAQTSGPRAREASNYARRIRLEHFIWSDTPQTTPSQNK